MNADFDSYLVEQATLRARLLAATAGLPRDDVDDLRQELLLDCLRRSPKFDETRGERGGFVRGVMRNQAAVLIGRRHRRARHEVLAGDLVNSEPEIPDSEVFGDGCCRNNVTGLDVSIDVRRVLRQLPGHLRALAWLLAESSISEICLATGKSRSRVYQMIRELRTAFTDAGVTA
jgi:RNA polymerase sigma-70 factor (ECF subfamily)